MAELRTNMREKIRRRLRANGASEDLNDQAIFQAVDAILNQAVNDAKPGALLLPELFDNPTSSKLEIAVSYQTHRGLIGRVFVRPIKRRILVPIFRWLLDFSRNNFNRQNNINQILFSCIQVLAIENAKLRAKLTGSGDH
jgi:hypothetical protein